MVLFLFLGTGPSFAGCPGQCEVEIGGPSCNTYYVLQIGCIKPSPNTCIQDICIYWNPVPLPEKSSVSAEEERSPRALCNLPKEGESLVLEESPKLRVKSVEVTEAKP